MAKNHIVSSRERGEQSDGGVSSSRVQVSHNDSAAMAEEHPSSHLYAREYLYIDMWKVVFMLFVPFYAFAWRWRNWKIYRVRKGHPGGAFWRTLLTGFFGYFLFKDMAADELAPKKTALLLLLWFWSPALFFYFLGKTIIHMQLLHLVSVQHASTEFLVTAVLFCVFYVLSHGFYIYLQRHINAKALARDHSVEKTIRYRIQNWGVCSAVLLVFFLPMAAIGQLIVFWHLAHLLFGV